MSTDMSVLGRTIKRRPHNQVKATQSNEGSRIKWRPHNQVKAAQSSEGRTIKWRQHNQVKAFIPHPPHHHLLRPHLVSQCLPHFHLQTPTHQKFCPPHLHRLREDVSHQPSSRRGPSPPRPWPPFPPLLPVPCPYLCPFTPISSHHHISLRPPPHSAYPPVPLPRFHHSLPHQRGTPSLRLQAHNSHTPHFRCPICNRSPTPQ